MGFNYHQVIGELIYAMTTCQPDISFPLIKLSQYSNNPARAHYEAAANIMYYLQCPLIRAYTIGGTAHTRNCLSALTHLTTRVTNVKQKSKTMVTDLKQRSTLTGAVTQLTGNRLLDLYSN